MGKKILVLFVSVFLLMPAFVAYGDSCSNDPTSKLPPCSALGVVSDSEPGMVGYQPQGSPGFTITKLVGSILGLVNWFSWFVSLAAVVMGLYSGFLFITARDNANQITTARNTMMYAIIGIGVAILAFSLVAISRAFLGV